MKLLLLLALTFNMQVEEIDQSKEKSIVLGGGCFWCVEAVFDGVKGIMNVVSGYSRKR